MSSQIIDYPELQQICGFSNAQFKKLDGLFCLAASYKVLNFRSVDCDFEEGVASFTFSKSEHHAPYLTFVIRRQGSRKVMYELYKEKSGRLFKSGIFERVFERLREEIYEVTPNRE